MGVQGGVTVDAATGKYQVSMHVFDHANRTFGGIAKGFTSTAYTIDPRLECRRNTHVVHGDSQHQCVVRQHRQLVVRDSGERRSLNVSWLGSEQRLTVSTMGTRIQALCQGLGFAWSPMMKIRRELEQGLLKPLPLKHGSRKYADLYLVITDAEGTGPATLALAEWIRRQVEDACLAN